MNDTPTNVLAKVMEADLVEAKLYLEAVAASSTLQGVHTQLQVHWGYGCITDRLDCGFSARRSHRHVQPWAYWFATMAAGQYCPESGAQFLNDPAAAIIREAENGEDAEGAGVCGGCDLIALSTHGRKGLQRFAMGSVTERVLSGTRLPVVVVRPQGKLTDDSPVGTQVRRYQLMNE